MAPPISRASAVSRKRSMTAILSDTFAPPITATSGRRGSSSSRVSVSTSLARRRPAAWSATRCATASVLA